jgi:hypothetical protein
MSGWRLAQSLVVLRNEVNQAHPKRRKASDGTVGDAAHAARNSDHNPHIWDPMRLLGVVTAIDVDDDEGRLDYLAEHLRRLGAGGDPRIKYVISDRRIASRTAGWVWRPYTGLNAHLRHTHLSVVPNLRHADSTAPWGVVPPPGVTVSAQAVTGPAPVAIEEVNVAALPTLRQGASGQQVRNLQGLLIAAGRQVSVDGAFGPATTRSLTDWQRAAGGAPDGVAGPWTWRTLLGV